MIATGYFRKSSGEADATEDARSTTVQLDSAKREAEQQGWTWICDPSLVFDEGDGKSGADFVSRPALKRLLASLSPHPPFDVVIVRDISRLSRGTAAQTLGVVSRIEDASVKIWSYRDRKWITTEDDVAELMLAVEGFAARKQRKAAGEDGREKLHNRARQGYAVAGWCFGYRVVRVQPDGAPCPKTEHKKCCHADYQVIDEKRDMVRHVFEQIAAGFGTKAVAVETGIGDASVIRKMIRRRLYKGTMVYGVTRSVDKRGRVGVKVKAPTPPITYDNEAWRIVPDELWQAANDRLDATAALYARSVDGKLQGKPESGLVSNHLLGGLCACGVCSGTMFAKGAAPSVFACTARHKKSTCSNRKTLPEPLADQAVLDVLERDILNRQVIERAIRQTVGRLAVKPADPEPQRKTLDADVRRLEQEVTRLTDAIASGEPIPAGALKDRTRRLGDLKARAEHLNGLTLAAPNLDSAKVKAELARRLADWRGMLRREPALARQILRKLVNGRITWTPRPEGYHFKATATYGRLLEGIIGQQRGDGPLRVPHLLPGVEPGRRCPRPSNRRRPV